MTALHAVKADLVVQLSEAEARDLTDRIRSTAEDLWSLLLEAHDRQAWKALGYGTWAEYVQTEFSMSRVHAHRLMDQGRVIREIEAASGVALPMGNTLSEREARDLKPHLEEVAGKVRDAVEQQRADQPDTPPERVAEITRRAVTEERDRIVREREERAEIKRLNDMAPDGFDAEADKKSMHVRSALYRAVATLADMPSAPHTFDVPEWEAHNVDRDRLVAATRWLTGFTNARKANQ